MASWTIECVGHLVHATKADHPKKWTDWKFKRCGTVVNTKKKKRKKKITDLFCHISRVLDHIFVFAQEHEDSIPGFGLDQHDHIVQSIDIMKMPARDMDFLTRWCSKLATVTIHMIWMVSLLTCETLAFFIKLHDPSWHSESNYHFIFGRSSCIFRS